MAEPSRLARSVAPYTCGFERYTATRPKGEVVTNELRVTQIYRREDGAWRIVHRHGDNAMPVDPDTG